MKTILSKFKILIFLIMITPTLFAQKTDVDLIVTNAKIYTVNELFDVTNAMAINNGKFIGIGTTEEILASFTSENIIDAKNSFIDPGFNDCHSHFLGYGMTKTKYANLVGTSSFDDIIEIV